LTYFPRPDEVHDEIRRQRDSTRSKKAAVSQAEQRKAEIAEFWRWAPEWMEMTGNDEAELLRRFPSYRGTKPDQQKPAQGQPPADPARRKTA
jgi:hypothetical protein